MWERFKAWCAREWEAVKKSGTMLLAWLQAAIGVVAAGVVELYNDPSINDGIRAALDPKYVVWYVLGLGVLMRFVRKKNSSL